MISLSVRPIYRRNVRATYAKATESVMNTVKFQNGALRASQKITADTLFVLHETWVRLFTPNYSKYLNEILNKVKNIYAT